jgi:argininosuccinate lyase
VGQSCLQEALAVTASCLGHHRDLQLLKPPLFRAIDTATDTSQVMAHGLDGVRFRPDRVRLDPSLHAAEEAYRLVLEDGIPFREAYRRVAEKYRDRR